MNSSGGGSQYTPPLPFDQFALTPPSPHHIAERHRSPPKFPKNKFSVWATTFFYDLAKVSRKFLRFILTVSPFFLPLRVRSPNAVVVNGRRVNYNFRQNKKKHTIKPVPVVWKKFTQRRAAKLNFTFPINNFPSGPDYRRLRTIIIAQLPKKQTSFDRILHTPPSPAPDYNRYIVLPETDDTAYRIRNEPRQTR